MELIDEITMNKEDGRGKVNAAYNNALYAYYLEIDEAFKNRQERNKRATQAAK
jgi:hypothetical protein